MGAEGLINCEKRIGKFKKKNLERLQVRILIHDKEVLFFKNLHHY